jgi:hypothetical protein
MIGGLEDGACMIFAILLPWLPAALAQDRSSLPAYADPPVARCGPAADGYAQWVTRGRSTKTDTLLPRTVLRAIPEARRAAAVKQLDATPVIALDPDQATALLGSSALLDANPSLKPFLVRNVVKNFEGGAYGGPVRVATADNRLYISAAILGCGGFFKNPLVVMLPQAPEGLEIDVVSAL